MTEQDLLAMNLHETKDVDIPYYNGYLTIRRVVGGWIYEYHPVEIRLEQAGSNIALPITCVFVPFKSWHI